MECCKEEFLDDLGSLVDDIEFAINDARNELDIDCVDDLKNIPNALEILQELSKDFY